MARRTDNPLSILVMGLLSVAFFGGVVVYFNETKPILKLKPELARRYGKKEFRTRFVPPRGLDSSYIVVEVPKELGDPQERLELGSWALDTYIALAKKQTLVQACHVRVLDEPATPPVVVSRTSKQMVDAARRRVNALTRSLARVGLSRVQIEVKGLSFTGAHVEVRARVRGEKVDLKRIAERAITQAERAGYVGLIELTLRHGSDKLTRVGGRDAVRLEKPGEKKEPKSPSPQEPGGSAQQGS